MYFLLHYVYLTALLTLQIKIFTHKTHEELIKYDVFYFIHVQLKRSVHYSISRLTENSLATIVLY